MSGDVLYECVSGSTDKCPEPPTDNDRGDAGTSFHCGRDDVIDRENRTLAQALDWCEKHCGQVFVFKHLE